MAASIYATPPPDLSSEDTTISDVTNSSMNQNNSTNNIRGRASETPAAHSTEELSTAGTATTAVNNLNDLNAVDEERDSPSKGQQPTKFSGDIASNTNTTTDAQATAPVGLAYAETHTEPDTTTTTTTTTTEQTATEALSAVAAAAKAAMQLQLLEALNDAAKKRRKQNNPIRLGALDLTGQESEGTTVLATSVDVAEKDKLLTNPSAVEPTIDYEEKLSKMLLPKSVEQLRETCEVLQNQQQQQQQHQQLQYHQPSISNISVTKDEEHPSNGASSVRSTNERQSVAYPFDAMVPQLPQLQTELGDISHSLYHIYCKQCGENFESEFKLSLHMLAEHGGDDAASSESQRDALGEREQLNTQAILSSVKVKLEHPDGDSQSPPPHAPPVELPNQLHRSQELSNSKGQEWRSFMAMGGTGALGFPHFSPEAAAAAALTTGSYLPLLGGIPGMSGSEGLSRPSLRIFNPEAFCDLCNKEFCNKYFLKTHKANKHGVYEPAASGASSDASGNPTSDAVSQMFQLQMQQHQQFLQQQQLQQQLQQTKDIQTSGAEAKQQKHQQQHQITQPVQPPIQLKIPQQQITPPAPPSTLICEMCPKRFTNVFALRRHRAKAHDQRPNASAQQQCSKPDNTTGPQKSEKTDTSPKDFQMPEGFQEDFVLEQEEVSFTPQPRKLSLQSQQLARDANFAYDKLKRLGVLNPEAFCELCCKEYCNKYFLRTHKWKRHGIFVPPDEAKEELVGQKPPSTAWPALSTTAMSSTSLNLTMSQDMMQAGHNGTTTSKLNDVDTVQPAKRIKLEEPDDDDGSQTDTQGTQEQPRADEESREQQIADSSFSPKSQEQPRTFNLSSSSSSEATLGLQNLQKLQSMIQQLSDLNEKPPAVCQLCGAEMPDRYSLHAHIIAEHSASYGSEVMAFSLQQNLIQQQQQQQQQQHSLKLSPSGSSPPSMMTNPTDLRCSQCDREFVSASEFKQHIAEVHLLSGSPLRDGFITPERPINAQGGGAGTRPPYTITPTSSYCEICNKELCNKYFMKTHMQRMHGIEIENGAQIGGVVCNICNKELCSKYFLRVHKHNTHGIVDEGSPLPQPRQNGLSYDQQQQQQQPQQQQSQQQAQQQQHQPQQTLTETESTIGMAASPFGCSDAIKADGSEATLPQQSYNEACQLCSRRFRNSRWLRAHLLTDHGAAGLEKLRELELKFSALSKPSSPTLKIPNGTSLLPTSVNPLNLAQALQSLNSHHLLNQMPKAAYHSMFGAVADQALQSPHLKEYQCSMCSFSTPYYAFLFIHERSHLILNTASGAGSPTAENQQQQPASKSKEDIIATSQQTATPTTQAARPLPLPKEPMDQISFEATDLSKRSSSTPVDADESLLHSPNSSPVGSPPPPPSNRTENIVRQMVQLQSSGKPSICSVAPQQRQQQRQQSTEEAQQTQAFLIEEQTNEAGENEGGSGRFMPTIVYLPVRERISGPLTVTFKLSPA